MKDTQLCLSCFFQYLIILFMTILVINTYAKTPTPMWGKPDNGTQYKKLVEKATNGDASSQWILGWLYENPDAEKFRDKLGLSVDYDNAINYYMQAAKQNHKDALKALKEMFMPQIEDINSSDWINADFDFFKSSKDWIIPDEKAYIKLLDDISILKDTLEDICVAYNIREYIRLRALLRLARHYIELLEQDTTALSWLGDCYFEGYGVQQNYFRARELYEKANKKADEVSYLNSESRGMLAQCYFHGFGGKRKVSDAKNLLVPIIDKDSNSKALYAQILYEERSNDSLKSALKLFKELEDKENPLVYYFLGTYYRDGLSGIAKDLDKAKEYFERAANKQSPLACLAMIDYCPNFHQKEDNNIDCDYCLAWYHKASKYGNSDASLKLHSHFLENKDWVRSVKFLLRAAQQAEPIAMFAYGQLLCLGNYSYFDKNYSNSNFDVPFNVEEGVKWIRRSAEYGCEPAIEFLRNLEKIAN